MYTNATYWLASAIMAAMPLVAVGDIHVAASVAPEYVLDVEVEPTKDNGTPWDLGFGDQRKPDIYLVIDGMRTVVCRDSRSCSHTFRSTADVWSIEVRDQDFASSGSDLVGRGTCRAEPSVCRLGQAQIEIRLTRTNGAREIDSATDLAVNQLQSTSEY